MKKQSPERKRFTASSPWWIGIIAISLSGLYACTNLSRKQPPDVQMVVPQQVKSISTDSFFAPIRVPVAAAFPKAIPAGKPIIRIDSSNGGAPFFTNYGTEQGLALTTVMCSAVDKMGNLWFGTAGGGISRYDGKSFTNYNASQGLAGNVIFCIVADRSDNLWICTSSGVSKFDGKRFTNFTTAQGLPGSFVNCAIQDHSGNLWFGTYGDGLSKYDGRRFTNYTTSQGLAENFVRCIMQDRKGDLWIGTNAKGVSKYDGKSFTNYSTVNGLAGNAVNNIAQDNAGNIWLGTSGGLTKKEGDRFSNYTTAQGLANNSVSYVMQDTAGMLWIGTSGGVSLYNGFRFKNFTKTQGLPDNDISSILQDKAGNIWLATYGGLTKYKGNCFSGYSLDQGLVGSIVFSIIQDKSGNFWFTTKTAGTSRYDGNSFANYTKDQGMVGNWLWEAFQDKAGNIWFSSDVGVCRYDGKYITTYTKAEGLPGSTVFSIMQDSRQNIWFGTKYGASRYDGSSFTNYTKAQGLPDNNVQNILEDKAGMMWFGTHDGGACRFDGKKFTRFTKVNGLPSNTIYRLAKDKYGDIWFGTAAGASKYDGKTFTNYGSAQGLMGNVIWGIVEDTAKNMLWFGTNTGLSGLKQKPPTNVKSEAAEFENFNEKTGYPINDVHCLCLDTKGIIWAGCGNGKVIKFDYGAVPKSTMPLNLEIQNIKLHNENICWNDLTPSLQAGKSADSLALLNEMVTKFGGVQSAAVLGNMRDVYRDIQFDSISRFYPVPVNLVLPFKNNNLTIDFAAIEPAMPAQVKYQFKLDGYDKTWSPVSNSSTAVFGNIREGNYVFELKALSPFGVLSQTTYSFKVLPPWQRTWWAYALFTSILAGMIWLIAAWRSRALKRENRILENKVENRTDQLKHSLEKLKSTQSQLIQREKMASLGELTAGVAHEIQNPLNFVNNFSDLNKELIDEMQHELFAGNKEVAIEISNNIKENEEKINQHGKRADGIVQNMLEHSRSSTGQMESSNINILADEYFRLSYHGIQAKDKTFNATMQTEFDPTIGELQMIPQDIGRVLLNLFNNAFYTVSEKCKKQIQGYEPIISVTTKKIGDLVEIRIKDNGTGIPQKNIDKIFQPFFTTKPTGQGTGLGLSLSYDIIRAHGGEIKVDSEEGECTEFIILIPAV